MGKLVKPNMDGLPYDPQKTVAIRDRWQSYLYIKHGAKPLDIYVSSDDDLVMVFDREGTKELYEKYRRYELK